MRPLLLFAVGLLFAAGAVGLFSGCGDMSTSPLTQNDDGGSVIDPKHGGDPADATGLIGGVVGTVVRVVEVIGVWGGQICASLGDGRKCGFDVPSGAISEPTTISMRVEDLGGRKSAAFIDFGPDGLTFLKPSTLFYDVLDPSGTVKTLTWYDPVADKWVVQGTAQVKNGRVTFTLNHFSKYGIS